MTELAKTTDKVGFNLRYAFGKAAPLRQYVEDFKAQSFLPWEIIFHNPTYERRKSYDRVFTLKIANIELYLSVAIEQPYGWAREVWNIQLKDGMRVSRKTFDLAIEYIEEYLPLDAMEVIVETNTLSKFLGSISHEMFWWYTVAVSDTVNYEPFQKKHVEIYQNNNLMVAATSSAKDFVKMLNQEEKRIMRRHTFSWSARPIVQSYFILIIIANLASALTVGKWQNFVFAGIVIVGALVSLYIDRKTRAKKEPTLAEQMKLELRQALKDDKVEAKRAKQGKLLMPDTVQS